MSHSAGSVPLNPPYLLYVLVVESGTTAARCGARPAGTDYGRTSMFARLGQVQPAQGADVVARAVGALALAALAVIHVVDLPPPLGPTPLVGIGYLGIIAAAVLVGGVMIARAHWLPRAPAGALAHPRVGGPKSPRAPHGTV